MRRAFTLAELLLVIAIAAILAALLYPVFSRAREWNCYRYTDRGNLRQLSLVLQMYRQDYDDRLPPHGYVVGVQSYTLPYLLHPYLKNGMVWRCATARETRDEEGQFDGTPSDSIVHYGYNWSALEQNGIGVKADAVRQPDETVAFAESTSYLLAPPPLIPVLGGTAPAYRHAGFAYAGMLDGHVKAMPAAELEETAANEGSAALGSGIDAYRYWNRR